MKPSSGTPPVGRVFLTAAMVLLALGAGWWLGGRKEPHAHGEHAAAASRKPLFYQSPMHPWIKSDAPGQCTICGMDLAPVYESGASPEGDAPGHDVVLLPAESPRIVGIETAPVRRGDLVRRLRVSGRLVADERKTSLLAAPVRGRIEALHVDFVGSEVTEGEPLLHLFSRELLAALSEYRLAPDGPLRAAVRSRLRQIGLSEGQIDALKGAPTTDLGFPLVAPRSGTVIAKKVLEGEWVDEGSTLLEIADLSRIWFVFPVYEQDLALLTEGLPVEIRTPSHPGETFSSKVAWIDPNLDESTRTVLVRAPLDNPLEATNGNGPRRRFLHQLFAEATVEKILSDRLLLPRSAVIWPGGQPRVFVDEGEGRYRLAPVKLGQEGESEVELLEGVGEGERVVTRGAILLDGQAQLHAGPAAEEPPAAVADRCPVSGEKLGSMGEPYRFHHEKQEVSLCCESCIDEFNSDPATYLRKLLPAAAL